MNVCAGDSCVKGSGFTQNKSSVRAGCWLTQVVQYILRKSAAINGMLDSLAAKAMPEVMSSTPLGF